MAEIATLKNQKQGSGFWELTWKHNLETFYLIWKHVLTWKHVVIWKHNFQSENIIFNLETSF